MGVSECQHPSDVYGAPDLNWKPKIYVGSSRDASIIRQHRGEVEIIYSASDRFNEFGCIELDEFVKAKEAYFQLIERCEKWK